MGKIQELSERLANQIAAGEVVERPASVVKELVENAIDAGSTQIDILVEEAGLKKIQVTDNGEGIAEDDVKNAFKRHATSKIHSRDDLFRIRTLGFRGEALPSIASVSYVTVETAVQGTTQGSLLRLEGGKVVEDTPAPLRQGTKITVENLFYNTPARLKYVKTLQTELANIGDIVNRLALSHPNIAFRLVHDGNKMLTTAGNGDLKQTLAGIFGVQTAKKMLAIETKDLDFTVQGYISLPEVTRASRNYISTIINGRYIKNFALNKAIITGYGSKLMVGRFPIAVLEITMDPLLVDVNVHPTKQEVRLSKEPELTKLISKAINDRLKTENLIPDAGENLDFKKKIPRTEQEQTEQLQMELPNAEKKSNGLTFDPSSGKFIYRNSQSVDKAVDDCGQVAKNHHENRKESAEKRTEDNFPEGKSAEIQAEFPPTFRYPQVSEDEANFSSLVDNQTADTHVASGKAAQENQNDEVLSQEEKAVEIQSEQDHPEFSLHDQKGSQALNKAIAALEAEKPVERFPQLEYFGQMHGTYLFAQSSDGLYIVDQHAAQERIKYEYFREKIGDVSSNLQELLVPIVLDYPNSDAIKLREKKEMLLDVGIQLEDFGANSFIIRAHPTWYPAGQEESITREMIDMLLTTGNVSVKKFREATAIMMSCKRSIKANHHLNELQARVLLQDLTLCENPFNCPHGRPVLIHFSNGDMEKMFKRIQDPHRSPMAGLED